MQAVILAGGLSKRLGGVPKAGLMRDGQTLLVRTLDAAVQAMTTQSMIAVVGPVEKVVGWLAGSQQRNFVVTVQEDPPYAGPAAGIAAGLAVLEERSGDASGSNHVLILACDMPHASEVVRLLLSALRRCNEDQGVMAVTGRRKQPLAAIYPLASLRAAVAAARAAHRLENASVFSLLATVKINDCVMPAGLTADIDTWEDARAQGIVAGPPDAKG